LRISFYTKDCIDNSIMAGTTRYKLNNGGEIQALGFGTWQDEQAQEAAVREGIKAGYRHIDTARV
jgi:alcohol dehydrogenase (NADP+)